MKRPLETPGNGGLLRLDLQQIHQPLFAERLEARGGRSGLRADPRHLAAEEEPQSSRGAKLADAPRAPRIIGNAANHYAAQRFPTDVPVAYDAR